MTTCQGCDRASTAHELGVLSGVDCGEQNHCGETHQLEDQSYILGRRLHSVNNLVVREHWGPVTQCQGYCLEVQTVDVEIAVCTGPVVSRKYDFVVI